MARKQFFQELIDEDILSGYPQLHSNNNYLGNSSASTSRDEIGESTSAAKKKTSLYISSALLRRLKIYCAQESRTMADVIEDCLTSYLRRKENLAEKHKSVNKD